MLALADDAALARLCIAVTAIAPERGLSAAEKRKLKQRLEKFVSRLCPGEQRTLAKSVPVGVA